jgi:PTS system nitrogen regulatory IIA component
MKLSDALAADRIELNLKSTKKLEAIEEMVSLITRSVTIVDPKDLIKRILDQEAIKSTGVEKGVAIPHARFDEIDGVIAALGIVRSDLDFQSLDDKPVHLIFLILSSVASMSAYLSVLGRTARIFHEETMREQVMAARTADEVMELIRSHEPV